MDKTVYTDEILEYIYISLKYNLKYNLTFLHLVKFFI